MNPWRPTVALLLTLGGALSPLACSKETPAPAPATESDLDPLVAPLPSSREASAPSGADGATARSAPDGAAGGTADAGTARGVSASAAGALDAGRAANLFDAAGLPACGAKPLPACPLQAWMKANAAHAINERDPAALDTAFAAMIALAPDGDGYKNWKSIAKDGADAARAQDFEAVKAACRGCHDQYKSKYRTEMRQRPLP